MSAWGRFDPLAKLSANDRSLRIVLKNPSIGHSSKNGFVDAFGLIGVQRACGEATKLARWQAPVQARRGAPSQNILRRVSGHRQL